MATFIIYGAATGIIRRVIWTDEPETAPGHVGPGEAIIEAPDSIFVASTGGRPVPDQDRIANHLTKVTGITPEPARCVVIDHATGEVVNVIMADPTIDEIAGHTLYQDASGGIGSAPDENGDFQPAPVT